MQLILYMKLQQLLVLYYVIVIIKYRKEIIIPEGPEVRKLVDQLQQYVNLGNLSSIEPISGRYTKTSIPNIDAFNADIQYSSFMTPIIEVNCKGKFIWFKIKGLNKIWYLFSTLGMTGSYRNFEDKYARVKFTFAIYESGEIIKGVQGFQKYKYSHNEYLYYCDMRNFGTMKFTDKASDLQKKLFDLGPDMLSNHCSIYEWLKIAEKRKHRSIVNFLMEQKYISGIGNIYKSESLYLARIDPRKKVGDCSELQLKCLYSAVYAILKCAYEEGGSTISSYKDLYGESSNWAKRPGTKYNHAQNTFEDMDGLFVYNLKEDIEGNKVETLKLDDGRTTFWVPSIQK